MLGFYSNFPRSIHKAETFSTAIQNKRLQQSLVETLYMLNSETLNLEDIAEPSVPSCRVIFEFGVADDNDFNFLDDEEKKKLLRVLRKKPFQVLDFLCVIRYQRMTGERKSRMRFDYYMLRWMFGESLAEVHVSHEKGTRHVSPDDLVNLIVSRVNGAFSKKVLRPSEAD